MATEASTRTRMSGSGGAGMVMVLGGGVAVAGAFLPWITFGIQSSAGRLANRLASGVTGVTLLPGKIVLAAGIVLVLAGLGLWTTDSGNARRILAVIGVAAAAVAVGATLTAFQHEVTTVVHHLLAQANLGSARRLGGRLGGRVGAGRRAGGAGAAILKSPRILQLLAPSHGSGLYLALTGAIVALAGSMAGVFWSTVPVTPVVAPAAAEATPTRPTQPFSKGQVA